MILDPHCEDLVRRHDRDRYLCAQFADAQARPAVLSLYAFNGEIGLIPERVSEPMLGRMRLQWWRDALDGIFEGNPLDHPVAVALSGVITTHALDRQPFDAMLAAREMDMAEEPPADLEAMVEYAAAVSGELTTLVARVLSPSLPDAAIEAARDAGTGWALVGLLRAIPFHHRAGRSYLPQSLLREAGIDPLSLTQRRPEPAELRPVIAAVAERASECLSAARARRGEVASAMRAALLPSVLADGYVRQLKQAGFDPYHPSVMRVGPGRLIRLYTKALFNRY